ncbi:MAG: PilZ domain-containing protein [Roseiarcus sp.]|jgi:hypothetical protein
MTADGRDLRSEPRARTRLRSAKLFDQRNKFLVECSIFDRSNHGARLKLFAVTVLPARFRLYDEGCKQLFDAQIAWARGQDVGVRLLLPIGSF